MKVAGDGTSTATTSCLSVIVATHERAHMLRRLLLQIAAQDFQDFEVVVVDDQSSQATRRGYAALWEELDGRFRLVLLSPEQSRRSPGVTRNHGIRHSTGEFIAFCDDDDCWIRPDHLSVAVRALSAQKADLFLANMQTSRDGAVAAADYYAKSWRHLDRLKKRIPGEADLFLLDPAGFAGFFWGRTPHVNTLVMRRTLLKRSGPFWEKIVFAEDHDWMFRVFDSAERIIFRSTVTADLDVGEHPSVARSFEGDDRAMFGILACLHALASVSDPALRKRLRRDRAGRLLELAQSQLARGRSGPAREFIRESWRVHPSKSAAWLYLRTARSSARPLD